MAPRDETDGEAVHGLANGPGTTFGGFFEASSPAGVAVYGRATNAAGYALKTSGRLRFDKVSGVATIGAGKKASPVIATGTDVTASSYVLLTPQKDPGSRRFWAVLNATSNTVTIKTNATAASSIRIAWLLVG